MLFNVLKLYKNIPTFLINRILKRTDKRADRRKRISDRRSSDRVRDDSILLVSGYNTSGLPFSEITKINDVSHNGISFQLRTPIEIDVILDVSICSAKHREAPLSP